MAVSDQFIIFSDDKKDDNALGRARSLTKTLGKKGKNATIPTNPINSEFSQVVNRLKLLQEEWRKRRITRKVPIITLKYSDQNSLKQEDQQIKLKQLEIEKNELRGTVSSLFKEMSHLKEQNRTMANRISKLRKVLHESKAYSISLKKRNENLTSDMDFQANLHEKQRRVWKTKIRGSVISNAADDNNNNSNSNSNQLNISRSQSKSITDDINALDIMLKEYELTIEKQREQIKYKNEQLQQQKSVSDYKKNQQYSELQKEINQLKNQRQQEIEEFRIKIEQLTTELAQSCSDNGRLQKLLEVTNNELNANRKLIEASRPLNATQTEQQLFQLEQDYLNLSEVLVACQHRVTKIENDLDQKQHELNDANRLIDEQNKTMKEYKKSIQLLQANLVESKSDQSDLINALQHQWEQSKEDVIRWKQKWRQLQLQHEKDDIIIIKQKQQQQITSGNWQQRQQQQYTQYNNNNNQQQQQQQLDPQLVVELHELKRKYKQKEDEIASQQMLMTQLMEQQKAFQKRNKILSSRLKQLKKGNKDVYIQPQPKIINIDNVTIDMKSLYDHYVRNPIISTSDMINKIRIISSKIIDNNNNNGYILPDFNQIRINSANTILIIIEDILIQRQNSINNFNLKIKEIVSLKDIHSRELNVISSEKKSIYNDYCSIKIELNQYIRQIADIEEKKIMQTNIEKDKLLLEIDRVKRENERIAFEFEQGANIWNSEKAILSAERLQIFNDISYISHNLSQLIIERQQFECEADQFQLLYVNLISHLREKGMQVEIEYVSAQNNDNNNKYMTNDNGVSMRRKRNTMRLKLYQTSTKPASLKDFDDLDPDKDDPDDNNSLNNNNNNILVKKQISSPPINGNKKKKKKFKYKQQQQPTHPQHQSLSHSNSYSDDNNNNNKDRKPSLWQRVSSVRSNVNILTQDDISPKSPRSIIIENKSTDVDVDNKYNEADYYIPFDFPDEFNLLDSEYKKLAMKFVSETDNYMSTDNYISTAADQHAFAKDILDDELTKKEKLLIKLEGWIEKKSPTFVRGWQKRWVVVKQYNMFYSKNRVNIKDPNDENERKKFLNAIPLLVVQYIVATDHSKSGRKFEIVARDPRTGDKRHYQWKASTKDECNKWVKGLNQHKKLLNARLQHLAYTGGQ